MNRRSLGHVKKIEKIKVILIRVDEVWLITMNKQNLYSYY